MAKTVLEPKDTVGLGSGIVMKRGKKIAALSGYLHIFKLFKN